MYGTELIFNFFPLVTNFHQLGSSELYAGSNDQMYGWADQTYNGWSGSGFENIIFTLDAYRRNWITICNEGKIQT